jgi:heptosyltransferase-2
VAAALADRYDIAIFGSARETALAGEIVTLAQQQGVRNCRNLAGHTSVTALTAMLAGLDLVVTNDSGPMHIAAAVGTPIVAIFGSTNHVQTCPWRHTQTVIVRHDLPCAPCMRRTCPLDYHACMEDIEPEEVIAAARRVVR